MILKIQDKLDDALQAYKSVIKIQPNHPLAHNNVGNILKTKGIQKEEINASRKAISLKPTKDVKNVHWTLDGPNFDEFKYIDVAEEWFALQEEANVCKQK